jgi:hypothetical protein
MKRILATTALVMIMAGGAYAQMGSYQTQPNDVEASDFIGSTIYATNTMPADNTTVAAEAEKDWDNVGKINDVILGRDGQIKAVVLGVGGFLGIGQKSVAVPMQDVKFVRNGDGVNDYFLVVNANKDALTNAPAYVSVEEKAADQQAAANDTATPADTMTLPADTNTAADATQTPPADTTTAMDNSANQTDETTTSSTTAGGATQAMTDENRTRLVRPDINRDGFKAAEMTELTADKLEGARVYGPNDEDVGEINRLILDSNGQIERVVLDVGGFLGMGERQIAVTLDELNIVRTDDGSDFRVYVDANQANLKAQPEYKG